MTTASDPTPREDEQSGPLLGPDVRVLFYALCHQISVHINVTRTRRDVTIEFHTRHRSAVPTATFTYTFVGHGRVQLGPSFRIAELGAHHLPEFWEIARMLCYLSTLFRHLYVAFDDFAKRGQPMNTLRKRIFSELQEIVHDTKHVHDRSPLLPHTPQQPMVLSDSAKAAIARLRERRCAITVDATPTKFTLRVDTKACPSGPRMRYTLDTLDPPNKYDYRFVVSQIYSEIGIVQFMASMTDLYDAAELLREIDSMFFTITTPAITDRTFLELAEQIVVQCRPGE